MLNSVFNKIFKRKKRKKKRGTPSLESKDASPKRSSELPVYPRNPSPLKRKRSEFSQTLIHATKRVAIGLTAIMALWVAWIFYDLPNIDSLNTFSKVPSIIIKSEDGAIVGSFGDIYGDYIRYSDFPTSLVDAVVATEDRNFFHHFGIDPLGLARATFANIRAGHVVQGGSTITQQVAKNVFLTPERSMTRKLKEMLLAFKLEKRFSKEDILSIYLNRVYLGAGNYGVDAAAHRYFDKSARDMTLSESAIIAGLLKAPSRFAPTSNPTLSRQRAEQVLINMQEAGYLTEQQSIRARNDLTQTMSARTRTPQSTLYFADWILDQLPEYIGSVQQDIVVTTTLRPAWQAIAEKSISEVMAKEAEAHDVSQAALLSMTPDGAVRAMIGGTSYAQSQYNRATQALRQPGSAFKIFVYLAGLEDGLTPNSMVDDSPVSVKVSGGYWQPKNYTGKYLGNITLKEALTESVNTVSVQIAQQVGLEHVIGVARRLGITSDLDPLPSIALGSTEVSLMELTTAYSHLAARGAIVYPYGITKIDTTAGETLYERHMSGNSMALRSDIVGEMNEMLMSVVENGTGKAARIGRPVAGKTGTTSDYRDAWFMGFTPDLVTGVWVGNDDNTPMKKVTGGMIPAQIWHNYMIEALAQTPARSISTDGDADATLPWQKDQPPPFPEQQKAMEHPSSNNDNVKLGHSFWDKLMNVR